MRRIQQLLGMTLLLTLLLLGVLWIVAEHERRERLKNTPLPAGLHPTVEEKGNELVQLAAEQGITVVITDGFRTFEEQDELYERGRSADGSIVTYAQGGESYHNYGLAIDYAIRNSNDELIWDIEYDGNGSGRSDWFEVADLAKELGFDWGGDWNGFKDYPHLEMTFGLSIRDLQRGERPDE